MLTRKDTDVRLISIGGCRDVRLISIGGCRDVFGIIARRQDITSS